MDYIVRSRMIGGFALVAYPAEYDNFGVMTFIVNQDGVVYRRISGRTLRALPAICRFSTPIRRGGRWPTMACRRLPACGSHEIHDFVQLILATRD